MRIWLGLSSLLVFLMIVVGGYTRLSGSGLSMVGWRPVAGIVPPVSQQSWIDEFENYKKFPEFQQAKPDMQMKEFKQIFYVEYIHRVLGRVTVLLYLLPFLYFWAKGRFFPAQKFKFFAVGLMLAGQGLLGWYMVKSGLANLPHVSHLRLAAHLLLASAIYGIIFAEFLQSFCAGKMYLSRAAWGIIILLYLQIFIGGMVAGLQAGLVYNQFPMMGDGFIPAEFTAASWDMQMLSNPVIIQFIHRIVAYVVAIAATIYAASFILSAGAHARPGYCIIAALALQLTSGILTLIMSVPTTLALLHQAGAVVLLSSVLYSARLPMSSSVKTDDPEKA